MPAWLKKVFHALIPAGGAALLAAVPIFGTLPALAVAKVAGGAFVAYLLKPARPAEPTTPAKP